MCVAKQKGLCNFGRRHNEEYFCKIILNLNQEEMLNIDISILSSGGHFVQWRIMVCAVLVEGIMRNVSLE